MDPIEAGRILARLQAHYPNLAADDEAAADWLEAIRCTWPEYAQELVKWFVTEWTKDRAPRVADWIENRRVSVHHAYIAAGYRALEAGPGPVQLPPEERAAHLAGIETRKDEARKDEARMERARMLAGPGYSSWTPLPHPDAPSALEPPLTFDQAYPDQAPPDGPPAEPAEGHDRWDERADLR